MPLNILLLAQMTAALAYTAFACLLLLRGSRTWFTGFLMAAALGTAFWAVASILSDELPGWLLGLTAPVRDGAWLALVLAVIHHARRTEGLSWLLGATAAAAIVIDAVFAVGGLRVGPVLGVGIDVRATHLLVSIVSLMLIENMMRNLTRDQFWSVKLLGIGLVTIFLYEMFERLPE